MGSSAHRFYSTSWLDILDGNAEVTSLYVYLTNGLIRFDAGCISTFAALGADVTFSIRIVSTSSETFDVTGDSTVRYSITATFQDDGSKAYVHDLGGTATITLYNTSGGSAVTYVGDEGDQPSVTSSTDDTVTFTTDHFSLYEVGEEAEVQGEDFGMIAAVGALAAVSSAVAAGLVLCLRRR